MKALQAYLAASKVSGEEHEGKWEQKRGSGLSDQVALAAGQLAEHIGSDSWSLS